MRIITTNHIDFFYDTITMSSADIVIGDLCTGAKFDSLCLHH